MSLRQRGSESTRFMGWAFLATYGVVLNGEAREFDQLLRPRAGGGRGTYGVRWFGCQTLV